MFIAAAKRKWDELDAARIAENARAGTIAAAVMNSQGGKEGGGAYGWQDFFGEPEEVSDEELSAKIRAAFRALRERREDE